MTGRKVIAAKDPQFGAYSGERNGSTYQGLLTLVIAGQQSPAFSSQVILSINKTELPGKCHQFAEMSARQVNPPITVAKLQDRRDL
jgi:hypothetical protein